MQLGLSLGTMWACSAKDSAYPICGFGGFYQLVNLAVAVADFFTSVESCGTLQVANVYRSLMAKISPETLPKTLIGLNVLVLHVWRLEQSSKSSNQ